jgi:hypothetical protein
MDSRLYKVKYNASEQSQDRDFPLIPVAGRSRPSRKDCSGQKFFPSEYYSEGVSHRCLIDRLRQQVR